MAGRNTVTLTFAGDSRQLERTFNRVGGAANRMQGDVGRSSGRMGRALAGVGRIASGFIAADMIAGAGRAVVGFAKDSIDAASNLGESLNAVNKVFGDHAATVRKWGENNATQFGLSQRAFNELATPLGAMLKNSGIEMGKVAGATINLTKRAADMASVFNTDVDEALMAIQAGLRGEADPLEKFGVGLSAAKVEAKAMAMTGKDVASSLTDQEKMLARVNLIMGQTKDVAGDFRDTSGELANKTRIATARQEEMQAKIGKKLLPVMMKITEWKLKLVTAIVDKVIPAFERMSKNMEPFLRQSRETWQRSETLRRVLGNVFRFLGRVVAAFYTMYFRLTLQFGRTLLRTADAVLRFGARMRERFGRLRDAISNAMDRSKDVVRDKIRAIVGYFWSLPGRAVNALRSLGSRLKSAITGALKNIRINLPFGLSGVGDGPGRVGGGSAIARARKLAAGLPVYLTSSYRSPAHNRRIGGSPTSYHMDRSNPAGDWGGPTWALDVLYRRMRAAGGWRELIWRAPGHYDHVHAAKMGGNRSGWTLVGEEGPELARLPVGSRVVPHARSREMLASDGRPMNVYIDISGRRLGQLIIDPIRREVRALGGLEAAFGAS